MTDFVKELEELPEEERAGAVRQVLVALYQKSGNLIDRLLRRLDHPEIPNEFWEAAEELEDGRAIEMRDEHFEQPPV